VQDKGLPMSDNVPPLLTDDSFPRFSEAEYRRRFAAVRQRMGKDDIAALIVYGARGRTAVSVAYLSNFLVTQNAHLLFPVEGEPVLFLQLWNHLPMGRRLAVIADVRWGGNSSIAAVAAELKARKLDCARIGLVGDLPWHEAAALREQLPSAILVNWTEGFLQQRLIKSAEEIEWIRRASEFSDKAMEALARELRPGLDERELPRIVESEYLGKWGTNEIHYLTTTSMHRPSICVPSQYHAARKIKKGDVLITEVSAGYWGYPGQILRPYAIGEEPTPLYRRLYEMCEKAFYAITGILKPGCTAQQVVDAAQFIEDEGYSIYDDLFHGFGGGYLPPILRTPGTAHGPVPDFVLQENMTVVVQPNVITLDEKAGVQLGHLMRITATSCEPMHTFPLQFTVTGK
jgi:Xaa-Pro dipeptidase